MALSSIKYLLRYMSYNCPPSFCDYLESKEVSFYRNFSHIWFHKFDINSFKKAQIFFFVIVLPTLVWSGWSGQSSCSLSLHCLCLTLRQCSAMERTPVTRITTQIRITRLSRRVVSSEIYYISFYILYIVYIVYYMCREDLISAFH